MLETSNKPKNSKSRCYRFSADDAYQVQMNSRFSMLETDRLDIGQQSQVLLNHEHREVKSFAGKAESKRKILMLRNNHGRDIGPMLQENLGSKFVIISIFKPNASPSKVVQDWGNLVKAIPRKVILL
jgi:hypothetical protein